MASISGRRGGTGKGQVNKGDDKIIANFKFLSALDCAANNTYEIDEECEKSTN